MINNNTLKLLDREGFGADIDSLESYLVDLKQVQTVSRVLVNSSYYMNLNKLLKEIKPESVYFTDKTSLVELELDKFDRLFSEYINDEYYTVFGCGDSRLEDFESYINSNEGGQADFIAIPNIQGLTVKITYINGYIYRINLIGKQYKYVDITDKFKSKVPGFIDAISKYELVEFRGYIVNINETTETDLINLCNINNIIRTGTKQDDLQVVLDDVYIDSSDLPYSDQWSKLEFLDKLDLNIAHRALIRNIESDMLKQALNEFNSYFKDMFREDKVIYRYKGLKVILNNTNERNYVNTFIYNTTDTKERQVFSSILKSFSTINSNEEIALRANIVPVKCNEDLTIDYIDIYDLSKLDTNNPCIGKEIKFIVLNEKAIII